MDFVLDPILHLIGYSLRQFFYVKDLNRNMSILKGETDKLIKVQAQVEDARSAGMPSSDLLLKWVDEVSSSVDQFRSITLEVERVRTRCCCSCVHLNSRRKLGKRVLRKIYDVKKLRGEGDFVEVSEARMRVPPELKEQRTSEEFIEELLQCLGETEVGVICIWGMGGKGKTALMKEIFNRLSETKDFDTVIWVTVHEGLNWEFIQQAIARKLNLRFDGTQSIEDKRFTLYTRLRNLRYMLILDDLCQGFSLDKVGIPRPERNGCKIVITTRLQSVVSAMKADRQIKVKSLSRDEARDLFHKRSRHPYFSADILPLAENIVAECGGLPLAITLVGEKATWNRSKEEWEDTLRALRAPAVPMVQGIERKVFLPLKTSYEYFEDSKLQFCLLYYLLYPQDYKIDIEKDLVRYWTFEEGLMDNFISLDEALKTWHDVTEMLKHPCPSEGVPRVLGHIATSIASPSSLSFEASNFLLKAGDGLEQPPDEKMWEGMRRISLMQNKIRNLQMRPNCPDLVSLFLGDNDELLIIGDNFFQLMPKLQILDLRNTGIMSLPLDLSQLVNLRVLVVRGCKNLQDMPPLGDLKELCLLDLSYSGILHLPEGIASLAKLKCLDLSHMKALTTIPCNVISRLICLEDLQLEGVQRVQMSVDIWTEVAMLQFLTSLRIVLPSLHAFTANDMNHPMWSRLTKFSVQFGASDSEYQAVVEKVVCIFHSRDFPIQTNFNKLMENAEVLYISKCQGLESLSLIIGDSKRLKYVQLREVQGLECAIDWKEVGENNEFGCLEELHLIDLTSLKKVFDNVPPTGFQQLGKIEISYCPKLTCIFSSSMVQYLHGLKILTVNDCEEIVEIVEGGPLTDTALQALQGLLRLYLIKLPKLKTICSQQLVLTSLQYIEVCDCPKLQKLPNLDANIQKIRGQIRPRREWWEGIEWDHEHSRSLYYTICQ